MAVPIGITASIDKDHAHELLTLLQDFMHRTDAGLRVAIFGGDLTMEEVHVLAATFDDLPIRYGTLNGRQENDRRA
jgi:hypothetical protein